MTSDPIVVFNDNRSSGPYGVDNGVRAPAPDNDSPKVPTTSV